MRIKQCAERDIPPCKLTDNLSYYPRNTTFKSFHFLDKYFLLNIFTLICPISEVFFSLRCGSCSSSSSVSSSHCPEQSRHRLHQVIGRRWSQLPWLSRWSRWSWWSWWSRWSWWSWDSWPGPPLVPCNIGPGEQRGMLDDKVIDEVEDLITTN